MIVLGVVLIVLAIVLTIPILCPLGVILAIVGVVLAILGAVRRGTRPIAKQASIGREEGRPAGQHSGEPIRRVR